MTQPVRWGVLGAAKFAREHMARAIHAAEGAEFAALATSNAEKAKPFQSFAPGITVHESYDALLADPTIEAVYIPLPNHLHVEWTKKAIAAGKHVLCEKPIAMKNTEIDELIALQQDASVFATEAYMIVHHPQWQRAKELFEDESIGKLIHVDGIFGYDNASDTQNVRNRPETGGGAIPDIGVYTYGCTRWVTGEEPLEITQADVEFENNVDVMSRVSARFPSFSAHWVNSMRIHPFQAMTFIGSKGIMRLSTPFNANVFSQAELEIQINVPSDGAQPTSRVERFPGVNQYVLQVEAFVRHVRDDKPYPWTLEDARGTQALIDAVFDKAGR